MSTSISVTRALTELKTIDKRIQKAIGQAKFVSIQGQMFRPKPDQASRAKRDYQSIHDLLNRRVHLKSAIVISNAVTRVTICGREMTVAEAIEMKSSITNYKTLLSTLRRQLGDATQQVEQTNERIRSDLQNKTSRSGPGPSSGDDRKEENLIDFSQSYMQLHGVELFDPLDCQKKIEELDQFITGFESEVDFTLSEKNATTMITIM